MLNLVEIDRIIKMVWEDRTRFDVIKAQFGMSEQHVTAFTRREMKPGRFII